MPGMVPTTASISRASSVTTVSRCANRSSSRPATLASSGETCCSDRVALGSSFASSMATPLSRSVRERSAEAESDSEGSDESSIPTACSNPETAPEIPEGGEVDARTGFVHPPFKPIEQGHQAVHAFGDFIDGVERREGRGGKPEHCARKTDHVSSKDGDSTP